MSILYVLQVQLTKMSCLKAYGLIMGLSLVINLIIVGQIDR